MKWSFLFFIFYFIPILCFANSEPQTCKWIDKYNNNKEETITTQQTSYEDENIQYESCQEAIAKKNRLADKAAARRNVGKNLTGGSRDNCTWPAYENQFPDIPAHKYKLPLAKIGEDEDGEPIYENCRRAQAEKQKEYLKNFDGDVGDATDFINQENDRLQQEAQAANLSANKQAEKAAKRQKMTSLLANAGSIAAGIKFAASCSGGATCNYTWAAISGALLIAGQVLNRSSKANEIVAKQYRGLTDYDDDNIDPGGNTSSGNTSSGNTSSGNQTTGEGDSGEPGVNNGSTAGIDQGDGDQLPEPQLPPVDTTEPEVNIDGTDYNIGGSETEKFLKDQGIKWNPDKKTITLPNGKTYTEDDLNNHPAFRNFSSTPAGKAFKNTMKGLEKQIADATGSTDGDGLGADGSEGDTASLGGGGFSGYDKGGSSGGGYGLGSSGGGPGSLMAGLDKDKKNGNKLKGMSVKMGKNRVGVSQDNIFEMIHRRYQAKRKKKHFIEIGM